MGEDYYCHLIPSQHLAESGTKMSVTNSEMEVDALRAVKQEANYPEFFPQRPNHTIEKRYHDPPEIQPPLAKVQRTLNLHGEQLSATVQSTLNVEADYVHDINVLERSEVVASDVTCAFELEEAPAPTGKAKVVAEMVAYAFETCEGSNYNRGTRMMVANLLQFLSRQYEEEKALAVVEIERLKEEHSKEKLKLVSTLEERSKLAIENLKKSASELERVCVQNEESKKGLERLRDLEHENQELRTLIAAMGKDMDALKNKNDALQNEFLSTNKTIQELTKVFCERSEQQKRTEDIARSSMEQQVKLLKSTIEERDRKIDMQNKEIIVFRELVCKGVQDDGVPPKLPQCYPIMSTDDLIHKRELHMAFSLKKMMKKAAVDGSIFSTSGAMFETTRRSLNSAIMCLGIALEGRLKALFTGGGDPKVRHQMTWQHCISRIVPHGYQRENSSCFKHVWNHWISAVMFYDFEDKSFGLKEADALEPVNKLDVLKMVLQPGAFESCSRFQAFVKRKYHSLFPEWFFLPPLLKILDADVYSMFMGIADRIWRLHQIGQWCDPPASIFRPGALGTRYDLQYMEPLNRLPQEKEKDPHLILLTFMPGFIVGDTVLKSQVMVRM